MASHGCAVKIEHEVKRIEESCNQIEQRAETNASRDQVFLADLELGKPLQASGIASDQPAAAEEGAGDVSGIEVMFGAVAKFGRRIAKCCGAGREQCDQRSQATIDAL